MVGEVFYIITKQEIKAYKALESEIERATFIDWFWQRRDVVPGTPGMPWPVPAAGSFLIQEWYPKGTTRVPAEEPKPWDATPPK